ncbi:hypothetical protein BCR39DRAFT_537492 [Naematelia encephala]|uniref:Steroid 5-alpha reductase C-terminal domain-containing protein n=1 Tax=Naematelia encephala TaxID=71784 RepID=A0A1Y2AYI3_9TREE|nr:hypothetical protein BCR39DRAFT_537492 [Naematelia encephala]
MSDHFSDLWTILERIMSLLGLHGATASRLAGIVGFTYAFQTAWAAYAVPNKTEKYYDLAGSLGFISTTLLSLYYPAVRSLLSSNAPKIAFGEITKNINHRQAIINFMYIYWAGRLGTFLIQRIRKHGKDSRFDEIKQNPLIFSGAWLGQATWITLVSLPAVLVNTLPRSALPPIRLNNILDPSVIKSSLGWRGILGLTLWTAGLGIETLADREKSAWRKDKDDKKHDEQFISSGLWGYSRHPNYLGEIILQTGPPLLALASIPAGSPLNYAVWLSPVFTYALLRYASGVPPLEQSAEKKWGDDVAWKKYRDTVGVLIPGIGTGRVG